MPPGNYKTAEDRNSGRICGSGWGARGAVTMEMLDEFRVVRGDHCCFFVRSI